MFFDPGFDLSAHPQISHLDDTTCTACYVYFIGQQDSCTGCRIEKGQGALYTTLALENREHAGPIQ